MAVVERDALRVLLEAERAVGRTAVFTNGCFDLLHVGHLDLLERAAPLADVLIVGVNHDAGVRQLKGAGRPVVPFESRARLLAALSVVDWVVGFEEETPAELIDELLPDVLVKGGDWPVERIVGRETVEGRGGRVLSLPLRPGHSSSGLIKGLTNGHGR